MITISVTLLIILLIIIALLLLFIFWFIGLFNKKVDGNVKVIFFNLGRQRVNRVNLRKLPETVRRLRFIILKRRGLFLKLIFKNYHRHRAKKMGDTGSDDSPL
ncbi:MAG: hypothetical protein WC467_00775 [Patescibacteria group bacterium]